MCSFVGHSSIGRTRTGGQVRFAQFPRQTLWTWQRSDDLRWIDVHKTAIAYLDQTVQIGRFVQGRARTQSFAYPAGAILIPVVRLEILPGAKLNASTEESTVDLILQSAAQPHSAALQIDFDATRSQRAFYRDVLHLLRSRMPRNMPLSMTALVSWCSYDDWISDLPVDEAVPMFFRMGSDKARVLAEAPELRVVEPLCQTSVGISTTESWPANLAGKRIYLFADRGWDRDFSLLANRTLR